ncbi:MAG: preprotein translocase subunit SecG [Deltaproteobacteria bacterium]|nr:MAG: preprotein translocase subunit SecG [Deltaproteobacteria bacterium]
MAVPYLFVVSVHVVLCVLLVLVILLQPGKGGDVGAAFGGGGGGGQVFGPRGPAGLLARATTGVAVAFMITSITLSYYSNKSLLNDADLGDEIERLEKERQEKETSEAASEETPSTPAEEE